MLNKNIKLTFLLFLVLSATSLAAELKPRLIVLTDISPATHEPDDMESMIRLLVHADLFEIEALVASTGWSNSGGDERPDIIHDVIDAYEQDLPNLIKRSNQEGHLDDESQQQIGYWPSPDYLRSRTVVGSQKMGYSFIGEDNVSDGSNLIIEMADEEDERPIWVTVWGGGNTLAQAVWQVQQERTPEQFKEFLHKIRTYTITDQDKSQRGGAFTDSSHYWLRKEFADDLLFIWDESAWHYQNSTGRSNWDVYATNIQNHGNLGAMYPIYRYGVEGDTPSFLYVMPNGLNDTENPDYGGWGGFFARSISSDNETYSYTNHRSTQVNATSRKYETQFYPAIFNNFTARMDWAKDGTGNRNPIVVVNGDSNLTTPIKITPVPGTSVTLDASQTNDPDGDNLAFSWWVFTEAGSYEQDITLSDDNSNRVTVEIPSDSAGKSFHVICEVTDDGTPSLTGYRRIIVEPTARIAAPASFAKPRTIITTDGEIDDMDSFIRFLLYSNEVDIDGLVYSSSMWHWAGDGQGTVATGSRGRGTSYRWCGTDWMEYYIDEYGKVYENLIKHSEDYPSPEYLKSIIRIGNIEFESEMEKETEGSNFIRDVLLDEGTEPVYLQIWGGTNTVARALKSIEEQYKETQQWKEIYEKVSAKAVIYTILDQDSTYREYVSVTWPKVRVIYNSSQFWSFAYQWTRSVPAELKEYLDGDWFAQNIKINHGPLMAGYLSWGDNHKDWGDPDDNSITPQQAQRSGRAIHDFISEGDSPAYFFLLDVGLRCIEDPSYGGWGGRFVQSSTNQYRWEDGRNVTDFNPYINRADTAYPQTRWVDVLQNDFAARADWCVMDYENANHAPVVTLNGSADLRVIPGDDVELDGRATDPDGDTLNYRWWQYEEADTYEGTIDITNADNQQASFSIPDDAQVGDTIHIILEVTDSGSPTLTRYQRVIVTIVPNN